MARRDRLLTCALFLDNGYLIVLRMTSGARPIKTIRINPTAFRFDSSVKEALFVKEGLNGLLLSMFYAGFKAKFSGADAGKPAA